MTKKILIITITFFIAGFIVGAANAEAITPERERFLCSTGVLECAEIIPDVVFESGELVEVQIATTTPTSKTDDEHREELLRIIAQLQQIVAMLLERIESGSE